MSERMLFAPGDRVKLTDRYANTLSKAIQSKHMDWRARRGIVRACNATQVTIMWPGRRSPDYIQVNGVELVREAAE
jgi:hypothetical protein